MAHRVWGWCSLLNNNSSPKIFHREAAGFILTIQQGTSFPQRFQGCKNLEFFSSSTNLEISYSNSCQWSCDTENLHQTSNPYSPWVNYCLSAFPSSKGGGKWETCSAIFRLHLRGMMFYRYANATFIFKHLRQTFGFATLSPLKNFFRFIESHLAWSLLIKWGMKQHNDVTVAHN